MMLWGKSYCFVYDWRVMYGINVIVLMGVVAVLAFLYFDNRPYSLPERVISRNIINDKVPVGADLRVRVVVDRIADCPTAIHRWLIDKEGVVLGNSITPSLFSGRIGSGLTGITIVPIPDQLKPGPYMLHSDIIIDCGRKGTFTSTYRDLPFEVVP